MKRSALKRLIPVIVSSAALAVLLGAVDSGALLDALSWRVATIFIPAMLAYGVATLFLEVVCIMRVIEQRGPGWNAWTIARIKCASYLLSIVHYALGVGAMTVLLRRRAGVELAEAASAVLLVSTTDLIVVLALATASAAVVGFDFPVAFIFGLSIAGFAGGLTLLRSPFGLGPLEGIRSLPFFAALRAVPLRRLAELAIYRAVFSAAFIAISGAAFLSFDIALDLPKLVVGMMAVAVVSVLPIAVAGLGTGQAAFLYVFRDVSSPETLLAVSLVLSAGMIVLRVFMGLLFAREFMQEMLTESRRKPTS